MLERDGYPAGVPCWVDTTQPDPDAAVDFYGGLFGWRFESLLPAGSRGRYLIAKLRARDVAAVGSGPEGSHAATWNTYIWVDSADATAAAVRDASGSVLTEPFDLLDAGRSGVFADPSRAVFSVWEPRGHRGAQLVNEPATWNWSDLNTTDPEGSKAFYGRVFGWEAATVDFGEVEGTMWRLPGYSQFLERFDPDLRRRHDEAGVPPGFSDAIGWMMPMNPQSHGITPHWSVTFSVADTDVTAARAVDLGGVVTTEPYDAGPTRVAAIRDPQGAAFTVSTYHPG